MNSALESIFNNFLSEFPPSDIRPIGSGHINDSYLVTTPSDHIPNYVLQRINHQIFKDIPGLMTNIARVTDHMRQTMEYKGEKDGSNGFRIQPCSIPMQVLELIPTRTGKLFHTDNEGNFWRLYHHIPGSHSYDRVPGPQFAFEGGRAFGTFQLLTAGLNPQSLAVTIPRFHDIAWRQEQFEKSVRSDIADRRSRIPDEIRFVNEHRDEMQTTQRLMESGQLPVRVTHNDTKFNNILFNGKNQAICIVDLDTVMPGTVLFDFGDAIRTGANKATEDEADVEKVGIDMAMFEAYTRGFLEVAGSSLTPVELNYLAFSAKFMTFLIGLRFLTDYINGDTYFKIHHLEHNLHRARAQFALLRSMEEHFSTMKACITNR